MYRSNEGISFLRILHKAPISNTSPAINIQFVQRHMWYTHCVCLYGTNNKQDKSHTSHKDANALEQAYSRARMSCCFVSLVPEVGRKFNSKREIYEKCKSRRQMIGSEIKQWRIPRIIYHQFTIRCRKTSPTISLTKLGTGFKYYRSFNTFTNLTTNPFLSFSPTLLSRRRRG